MIQINCNITTAGIATLVLEDTTVVIGSFESASRVIFKVDDSKHDKKGMFLINGKIVVMNYTVPQVPGAYEGPTLTIQSTVPVLSISDDRFLDENGKNYNWKGHIDWMLYKRSLDGVIIEPLLQQRYNAGSRAVAFLCQASNIERFYPADYGQRYFDHFVDFLVAIRNIGMLAMPVVYADESQVKSGSDFVYRVAEVCAGKNWVFPSLGNEYQNNGFDPGSFTKPNGNYWSRGSNVGDTAPYYPSWDWKEWHPRRDFPKVLFGNDDAWYVKQGTNGDLVTIDSRGLAPTIVTEPIGFWNQNVPNHRSNDPNLARVIGGTSIYFARGANFMSEDGLRSNLWDDVTYSCAVEFFKAINQV